MFSFQCQKGSGSEKTAMIFLEATVNDPLKRYILHPFIKDHIQNYLTPGKVIDTYIHLYTFADRPHLE